MKTSAPGTTVSRMKLSKVFAVVSSATFAETSFFFPSFTPTTAVLPEGPPTLHSLALGLGHVLSLVTEVGLVHFDRHGQGRCRSLGIW